MRLDAYEAFFCRVDRLGDSRALRVLALVLADCCGDPANVEIVRLADVLANSVQFLDDKIAPLHVELPDGSSSGVQMIGSAKARGAADRLDRTAHRRIGDGVRFHVKRYFDLVAKRRASLASSFGEVRSRGRRWLMPFTSASRRRLIDEDVGRHVQVACEP